MENTELKQRIADLEAENRAFKRVNEELCNAINSQKHRQLLNSLLKKGPQ